MVIGDGMIDRYSWGKVTRISPEAPVPVVDVERQESRLGGAANVALNLAALGAEADLCMVCGDDEEREVLLGLFKRRSFDPGLLITEKGRKTTVKTRIMAQNQQILRVDLEDRHEIQESTRKELLASLLPRLQEYNGIIFEDYDKGLLSAALIAPILEKAEQVSIPTMVDPKFRNYFSYKGCSLFKPNLKELNQSLGTALDGKNIEQISEAVAELRRRMPHRSTLITLSEHGMLALDESGQAFHHPAHLRKIRDVSGAGDTVVAVMGLALAAGLELNHATSLANLAGGLVCEEVGVVPINAERFFAEA